MTNSIRVAVATTCSLILSFFSGVQTTFADGEPRGGVPGACCDEAAMLCTIRTESVCVAVGGVFLGGSTTCDQCFETAVTANLLSVNDTFELAAAPEASYGTAGALNVSGSQARNNTNQVRGVTDTWMKFDSLTGVNLFNSIFGAGNWTLSSAVLRVYEVNPPINSIFGIGSGQFTIRWLANDNWSQGIGRPNSPGSATGNVIGFTYGRSLLNATNDEILGTTFINAGTSSWQNFNLPLTPGFTADLMSGTPVSLYFVATDTRTGFTFHSGSNGNYPRLILTAVPLPDPPCRGDLNHDGNVLGDDIGLFVAGYLDPDSLAHDDFVYHDMDDSGELDQVDVACFVAALLATHDCSGGPFTCP